MNCPRAAKCLPTQPACQGSNRVVLGQLFGLQALRRPRQPPRGPTMRTYGSKPGKQLQFQQLAQAAIGYQMLLERELFARYLETNGVR